MAYEESKTDVTAQVMPNIPVEDIENDHMYLLAAVRDKSGSMDKHRTAMVSSVETFKQSVIGAKQSDEMLVSFTDFSYNCDITSTGFHSVEDLASTYSPNGWTALYDAIIKAKDELLSYMEELTSYGIRVKGALVIFSDGGDNDSRNDAVVAANAIKELKNKEIVTAFVAFGNEAHGIAASLGIDPQNTIETSATDSDLRKIWGIISKSAISASKAAAAGAAQTSFFDV